MLVVLHQYGVPRTQLGASSLQRSRHVVGRFVELGRSTVQHAVGLQVFDVLSCIGCVYALPCFLQCFCSCCVDGFDQIVVVGRVER